MKTRHFFRKTEKRPALQLSKMKILLTLGKIIILPYPPLPRGKKMLLRNFPRVFFGNELIALLERICGIAEQLPSSHLVQRHVHVRALGHALEVPGQE